MPTNDPLGNVWPGDEPPNAARMWNRLTGGARQQQRTQMGTAAPGDSPDVFAEPAAVVSIQAGAAGLDPFTVSAWETPVTDADQAPAEARRRPVFAFAAPASAADAVAVTVEAAVPRGNARAAVAGVTVCRLLVRDPAHRFAAPIPGDSTRLGSADAGYPVRWRSGASGEVWAFVLLDRGAGAGSATACRTAMAGLLPTSKVTFTIREGTGWCAEIAAKTLDGWRPDPAAEKWYSIGTFPTKLGATSLTYTYDDANGDPVVLLTATTGEGSSATTVTQPLKYVTCADGCEEFAARPLLWCDSEPVTDCDELPDGAPRRYRLTAEGGTGSYAPLNGEWTALWDSGCEWDILANDDGVTGTVQWLPADAHPRRQLVNLTYPDGTTAVLFSADADSTSGCVTKTGTLDVDLISGGSSGSAGAVGTPPTLAVTPVGPCESDTCGDNTFLVRVCRKCHTKYDCEDAIPLVPPQCFHVTSGYTGATVTSRTDGAMGPGQWLAGGGGLFRCDTGATLPPADEFLTRCGWDINLALLHPPMDDGGVLDFDGRLIRVIVYYEPDADDGAGAWVMALVNFADGSDCNFVTPHPAGDAPYLVAANDPDPADDPFELVFRWPVSIDPDETRFHEVRLDNLGCLDPAPKKYACVEGVCVEAEDGEYDEPTCGGDCTPAPPTGCLACDLLGNVATLSIPNGPHAGTHTATWGASGGAGALVFFDLGADNLTVWCDDDGVIHVSPFIAVGAPTYDCGPPAVITIPCLTSVLGCTGDITVTT